MKTTLLGMGGLLLAVGGPIGYFSAGDFVSAVRKHWTSGSTAAAALAPDVPSSEADVLPPAPAAMSTGQTSALGSNTSPAPPATTPSLEDVLRFDVTVDWIMQRWPRVSAGLPHLQLQGYRVPLVTGSTLGDVAGSLTYYFDPRQQVQRITLHGATGDPRVLTALVTDRFHFVRRLTNDPGVALYETVDSSNRPTGTLKIRSASVIKSNQPYTRFVVDLVIDRPE